MEFSCMAVIAISFVVAVWMKINMWTLQTKLHNPPTYVLMQVWAAYKQKGKIIHLCSTRVLSYKQLILIHIKLLCINLGPASPAISYQ